MRAFAMALILLLLCLSPLGAGPMAAAPTCPAVKILSFRVEKEIRRSQPGFTEGLEVHDGAFYESTGDLFGDTQIDRIDPASGKVLVLKNSGKSYFGEGLTFFKGRLYQMTWREHRVFVFGPHMRPLEELSNPREGWGLTHDAARLIASDGSARLFFLSPQDFHTLGAVTVTLDGRPLSNLNELEYVDGAVWANVFEDWSVVRISPITGCVEARADIHGLRDRLSADDRRRIDFDSNFVPNGIAHDPATGLFTLTGKYWPLLFSGRFVEGP